MSAEELSSEHVDDPELPEFQVRAWIIPTGGIAIYELIVAMALVPFVQAIATAVGTRLGETLDDTTRRRLQRLLGRVHDRAKAVDPPPVGGVRADQCNRFQIKVILTIPERHAEVPLVDSLPAEAIVQLARMTVDTSKIEYRTIFWHPTGDPAGRWYAASSNIAQAVWDETANRWVNLDQPDR